MSSFKSNKNPQFRSQFAENIFNIKYAHEGAATWSELSNTVVEDVCRDKIKQDEKAELKQIISDLKFVPGGRYLFYCGRPKKFFFNCFLLKAEEDTRQDWGELSKKAELCLMVGGGIGVDYTTYRGKGRRLAGTGGVSSGPLPKMDMINSIGKNVVQGGSRRSAIYGSLDYRHSDIEDFLVAKDWKSMPAGTSGLTMWDLKNQDPHFPCPLDGTNISVNYTTDWLLNYWKNGDVGDIFLKNVRQALSTSEPGMSFNFFDKEKETLRNACCEVVSEDDSDCCNLGSINLSRINSLEELKHVVELATKFLICGTLRADFPYDKVRTVQEKNRRLGLGLMGIHEKLIQLGSKYEVTEELCKWLHIYKTVSDDTSKRFANELGISVPVAKRSIAPTGSLSILASTSSGIEPIYAVAYKRRYLKNKNWHYMYVIDGAAQDLMDKYGTKPETIESAIDLAAEPEKRIKFQAEIQEYVDMAISSTINMPAWGTKLNNEDTVRPFANTLAKYAHLLRGFTCFSDGSRGSQPLQSVPYEDAMKHIGTEFQDHIEQNDICDISGRGGHCGS